MLYDELNDTEAVVTVLVMGRDTSLMSSILKSIHHVCPALPYWDTFAIPRLLAMPISDTSIMG
jgi:hypothetical protein